ncbi:MAG: DUF134 domain-containing protein [Candidatus Omnitrophica bacterium]|nr:DUF134 domain-containing protein [Candidatus Omnitrophota bacterium]
MRRGRPKKARIILKEPEIRQFSPRGRRGRPDYVTLTLDQFEAVRFSDLARVSQKEAARQMNISQQTFSRILNSARRTLAEALAEGKIIRISPEDTALTKEDRPAIKL